MPRLLCLLFPPPSPVAVPCKAGFDALPRAILSTNRCEPHAHASSYAINSAALAIETATMPTATPTATPTAKPKSNPVKVWDLGIRLFHWLLVLLLPLLWLTAEQGEAIAEWAQQREIYFDYMVWHARLGYLVIGSLVFRVLWGFVGSETARFRQFLYAPKIVIDYLRRLFDKSPGTFARAGHNPAGGWMVLLMLLLLISQTMSGLFNYDDVSFEAPLYASVDEAVSDAAHSWHEINFDLILIAVSLHLLAIAFYTYYKKEKLVPPMLSGISQSHLAHVPRIMEGWRLLLCGLAGAACTVWLWRL